MSTAPHREVLRRTPHLDVEPQGRVTPGTMIRIRVYADTQAARPGEQAEDIVVRLPAGVEQIDVQAQIVVSPQLEVVGQVAKPLRIDVNESASKAATFDVRVRSLEQIRNRLDMLPAAGRASISAVFNYRDRPSGSVTRLVDLDLDLAVRESPDVQERVAVGTLRVEPEAERADLTVQVRAQPINDGRQFQCWVTTPLIDADEEASWQDWNLPATAEAIVRGYMSNFVADSATTLERLASLRGSGRQLFDAAPVNFTCLYWKLVDAGHAPKTIAVISDEPFIPWELMIPHRRRNERSQAREPLGVECAIARWVLGDGCAGRQELPLSDSLVIAPEYQGTRALAHAEDEAKFVLKHFQGIRIKPASLERIDEVLTQEHRSLLHIVCHGADSDDSTVQAIYLDGDRRVDTTMFSGLDSLRAALEEHPTLVVINACEVGRPKPALVSVGGFAQTFIDLGAAGVVAPLWSVRDDIAHEVAMAFYNGVLEQPQRPFADILRELRARAYDRAAGAEDTYAAYCYYGDPLARAMM